MADSIQIQILDGLYKALKKQIDYYSRDDLNLSNVPKDERVAILAELGTIHTRLSAFANSDMLLTLNDIETIKKDYEALISNIPTGSTYDDTEIKQELTLLQQSFSFVSDNKLKFQDLISLESNSGQIDNNRLVNKNTFVIDGDSIAKQNSFSDISTNLLSSNGFFTWANVLLNNRMKLIANNGVGGDRTDQLLARLQSSIDLKPKFIIINIGKNDISQNIDVALIKSNLLEIYNRITKAGILCIMNNIIPYGTYNSLQVQNIFSVNEYLFNLQSEKDNLIIVDMYSAIVNPSSDISRANLLNTDNVHPSAQGAYFMGVALSYALDKYLPSVNLWQGSNGLASQQLSLNPYLLGGETIATSWTFFVSNGIGVASKLLRDNGLEWQQIEMTTYGEFSIYQSIPNNLIVGKKYKFIVEYEIDETATEIDSYIIELQAKNSSNVAIFSSRGLDISSSITIRFPQKVTMGVIETSWVEITPDTFRIVPYIRAKLLGKIRFGRTRLLEV